MPKSKSSAKVQPSALHGEEAEIHNHPEENANSDQESDAEVSSHTIHPQAPTQSPPIMHMPYIEGPHMDWTVNDRLYHRFLKCSLKFQNHTTVQACSTPRMSKVQEGSSLEWQLWHGSVCVLGPA